MDMGQNADDGSASQHDLSPSFEYVPNDTEAIEALLSSSDVNINLAHAEDSKPGSSAEPVGSSKDTIEVDATLDSDFDSYLLTVFEDMTDEDEVIISMSTEGKHERGNLSARESTVVRKGPSLENPKPKHTTVSWVFRFVWNNQVNLAFTSLDHIDTKVLDQYSFAYPWKVTSSSSLRFKSWTWMYLYSSAWSSWTNME